MEIRIVIVEPRYQINLGYSARVALNFGVKELYIVNPKCNYKGARARMYSKHSYKLLDNARICSSISEATKSTLTIGTSAIWHKSKAGLYNVYEPEQFIKFLKEAGSKSLSLIIGREGTGMTSEELRNCDASIYVPAYYRYSTMNTSHALAVLLYILTQGKFNDGNMAKVYASDKQKEAIVELFRRHVGTKKHIRDKETVVLAFRHIINRSMPTKTELSSLATALTSKIKNSKKHG